MTYDSETRRDKRIVIQVDADLAALLPGFLIDWQKEVRAMKQALEKNNYETIRKIGHDMKGIGGSCGLDEITDRGSSLVEGANAMDSELIRKNLDRLADYLDHVEFVYE
jgi:HPt (histidine-containing phosphotransfer) domain-containing protein